MVETIRVLRHFTDVFALEDECIEPSSYWEEDMQMIADETLAEHMQLYCAWNTYHDRTLNVWLFFAPNHIFRVQNEESFVSVLTQDIYLLHKMYGKQCWSSGCASI